MMMKNIADIASYLPSVLSTLFRVAVYIFLRIIPARHAKFILPPLYVGHLASSWLLVPSPLPYSTMEKDREFRAAVRELEWPLLSLLLSLPSPSKRVRLSIIFINTLLLLAVTDFVVTPFIDPASDVIFTRVGAVYPDSVKITARYKEMNSTDNTSELRILFREIRGLDARSNAWSDGPIMIFKADNDWVDTRHLTGLWPNTSYEYTLSTPERIILPYPSSPIRFRTFPDPLLPSGHHYRFIASSCMIPNHPYDGPLHRRTIKGFDLLADYIFSDSVENNQAQDSNASSTRKTGSADIKFLLFLGDFIYADVPVYIGDDKEGYRRLYRRNYQSESFRKVYERLPIFHAYDDHEFKNNFGAAGNDSTPPYLNAASAFHTYNFDANYNASIPGEHYFEFQYGDSAFFVMDTRRHREDIGTVNRTMLGEKQRATLRSWLTRVNETSVFKFVVTSVPFTSLWGHDALSDSWAGFPEEKRQLLDAFYTVPNIILLSGDRHEFAAIEYTGPQEGHNSLWEFSTSPLSMFYVPFFRTLQPQSQDIVRRNRTATHQTHGGVEMINVVEDIPTERVLKYLPVGNHKWSTIEINTLDAMNPTLSLEVMIDGKTSFKYNIRGIPVKLSSSTALGEMVPNKIKDLFEKLGLHPSKWF